MMSPREAAYRAKALFSEPIDAEHRSVGEALYIAEQTGQGQAVAGYMSAKEAAFRARALFPDSYPVAPQTISAYTPPVYGVPAYGPPVYGTAPVYGTPVYGTPLYGSPVYGVSPYVPPYYGAPVYTGQLYGYNPPYGYGQPRDITATLDVTGMVTPTPQPEPTQQIAAILPPQPQPVEPEQVQTEQTPAEQPPTTLKLNTDADTTTTEVVVPNNLTQEQRELVEELVKQHLENDQQKAQDRQEYEQIRQTPWITFLGGVVSVLLLLATGYTVRQIIRASREDEKPDNATPGGRQTPARSRKEVKKEVK